MQRVIAAALVIALAVVCSRAQEEPKGNEEDPSVLGGPSPDFPLSDLIVLTMERSKMVFLYNPKQLNGELTLLGPREGYDLGTAEKLPMLLQTALEQFRMCFVKRGDVWVFIPMAEAANYAPTVTESELPSAASWQWVTVPVSLRNLEANAATGALRNLTSRMGGTVQPIKPASLIICDRADRATQLVKLVREMDSALESTTIRYVLPEGIDAVETATMLGQLFPPMARIRTFAPAPGGKAVLAHANSADQVLIAQAVNALRSE